MSKTIFIDTLFVVALVNERDQYHQRAVELADRYEGFPFLITDSILLEIGNTLARNYKIQAIDIIERLLSSDDVDVIPLARDLFKEGFDLYKTHKDKAWGLVDCISFVVMRQENVQDGVQFRSCAGLRFAEPAA